MASARGLHIFRRGTCPGRHDDGYLVGAGRYVDRGDGVLRLQGTVLCHATDVPGAGLAAGIAWINSLGNLGGFFGPWYVGLMKDWTGSFAGGLYGLALFGLISAFVCAFFLHIPNRALSAALPTVDARAG